LNRIATRAFDVVLGPIDRFPPMWGLVVLSLLTAIAVLYVFKWTANQAALVRSKRAMQAGIFEMRLFNDDLVALFRAQGEVLRHTLAYLRFSFVPTLWLIVPMALLMLHMEYHFGYAGLGVGQAALVTVRLSDPSLASAARLEAPTGVTVETPAVVFPSSKEIVWRIRPSAEGTYRLLVHVARGTAPKTLLVSDRVGRRSPLRPSDGFLDQVLNPSEPPVTELPGVEAIALEYPERPMLVLGWNVGWSGIYLALTLAFAFALKGRLGVEM
jgi:uncharacterized membrane protein (DUF106 family)